jgi:hypothetical protein
MPLEGHEYKARELAAFAYKAGFKDAKNLAIAVAVCFAESAGYAKAYHVNENGTIDRGLMQINSIHGLSEADSFDPQKNFDYAHKLFEAHGFQPWAAFTNGSYKSHLKLAGLGVGNFLANELEVGTGQVYGYYK